MLLFEHKQYLQSYNAENSMQTEIWSFKILMATKKRLVGTTTSYFPGSWRHKPCSREHATKGRGHAVLL